MKKCNDIALLISCSQDREMTPWEQFCIQSHQLYCTGCRHYAVHLESLRAFMDPYMQADAIEKVLGEWDDETD